MDIPASPAAHPEGPAPSTRWRLPTRIAFRFFFIYFILYFFPFPWDYVPFSSYLFYFIFGWYRMFWSAAVPWVGEHALHLSYPITVIPNGSGDTTWNYVQVLCMVVFAIAAAALWSLLDRRRAAYPKLYQWLRLFARLGLGAVLISYGLQKVLPLQMPAPALLTLSKNLGDIPPGGLLWAFIGASPPFEIFTGVVETVSGLLLIYPRTAVLGAIMGTASMFFIFMLNLCYDIPVKLYSFHLLALGAFLLAPEIGRLARLFFLGEQVALSQPLPLFSRRWANLAVFGLQAVFAVCVFHSVLNTCVQGAENYGFLSPRSQWYGIWTVEEYSRDGQILPQSPDDSARWESVIFDEPGWVNIREGGDYVEGFNFVTRHDRKALMLYKGGAKTIFTVASTDPQHMTLTGSFGGHHLIVKLRRMDDGQYILLTRGFHWINEHPYFG